jgi:hypothetical protein
LAIVEHDRQARSLMDADFEQQLAVAVRVIEAAHRLAHAQCRGDRSIRRRKGRHHRVTAGLNHGPGLGGHDLVEDLEMRAHEVERGEIADAFVKLGRASEIREQEGSGW